MTWIPVAKFLFPRDSVSILQEKFEVWWTFCSQENLFDSSAKSFKFYSFSCNCSISIPPEKAKRTQIFDVFRGQRLTWNGWTQTIKNYKYNAIVHNTTRSLQMMTTHLKLKTFWCSISSSFNLFTSTKIANIGQNTFELVKENHQTRMKFICRKLMSPQCTKAAADVLAALWIWKKDRQQKNPVVYENYDGKKMPSCIRLMTVKLDWLIGKTSVCIATY